MTPLEHKRIAIVLIEDNPDDLMLLTNSLEYESPPIFDVRHGETLCEGLALIRQSEPDIVLLDLSLPDSFGIETVKTLQNVFPLLPIIVLTGYNDDSMALGAIEAGAQDYLIKGTVTGALLGRSIKYAIERHKSALAAQKIESELREKDIRLNFAAASAKLGLWDWDVKSNEFKFGDGMYELLKLERTDSSPTLKQFLDVVHDADRKLVKGLFKKNGAFDFDFRIVLADKQIRHIQMKGEIFLDSTNNPVRVAGVCQDITERKIAEEALKKSEETLKLALDASHMGVWDFSMEDRATSHSVVHDGIFGVTSERSQWTAKIFMEYVHSEDREFVKAALNESLVSGRMNLECRIINKDDGTVRWILLQAKQSLNALGKSRMIGTIRDITDAKTLQHLAKQARERSDKILNAVVEYAPTGVAMLDPQMRITSVNRALLKLSGKASEVLLGNKLDHVLPFLEVKKACARVEKGEPAQISRLFIPTQSGEEMFLDISIWPVKVSNELTGSVLQMSDLTHTVLLERQRDDFVASVAHDIKNPLVGASRLLEILCNEAAQAPSEKHGSYLNVLKDSTQNLLSLVQNLVDVYRYETLVYPCHFEKISSNTLFSSCVHQMKMFADTKNVKIHTEIGVGAEAFDADAIGIRRVIMNLLHNAVKFNKPSGSIHLSIQREKGKFVLTVTDTGYGISEFERQNLFQRFAQGAQGKRNSSGTGLGLYLSKQIISAHGGTISCKSYIDQGSVFSIELPLKRRATTKNTTASASAVVDI